jgi:hypothetical protein
MGLEAWERDRRDRDRGWCGAKNPRARAAVARVSSRGSARSGRAELDAPAAGEPLDVALCYVNAADTSSRAS